MINEPRFIEVPNLPLIPSHAPAGWADLIQDAIELLDREFPSGWRLEQIKQKFGGLRIYYEPGATNQEHREGVREAISAIEARSYQQCDICGAPARVITDGYDRRVRCGDHEHATDIDIDIVESAVTQLKPGMRGVWLVETQGSSHIWDLDNMTYTRRPGPSSHAGGMRFDGNAMPITRVEAWPKVGESFFVWFDDPDEPQLVEHYRISSTVSGIMRHHGSESDG
ncbi:hypothetical protein ACLM5J_06810 [Nocardioides sp. Bht2]|uniref:hypothetical protein n=1 Tax=Nocardioides sp. Bht2 TaxID=3392297 RepID=UPI0039B4F83D